MGRGTKKHLYLNSFRLSQIFPSTCTSTVSGGHKYFQCLQPRKRIPCTTNGTILSQSITTRRISIIFRHERDLSVSQCCFGVYGVVPVFIGHETDPSVSTFRARFHYCYKKFFTEITRGVCKRKVIVLDRYTAHSFSIHCLNPVSLIRTRGIPSVTHTPSVSCLRAAEAWSASTDNAVHRHHNPTFELLKSPRFLHRLVYPSDVKGIAQIGFLLLSLPITSCPIIPPPCRWQHSQVGRFRLSEVFKHFHFLGGGGGRFSPVPFLVRLKVRRVPVM